LRNDLASSVRFGSRQNFVYALQQLLGTGNRLLAAADLLKQQFPVPAQGFNVLLDDAVVVIHQLTYRSYERIAIPIFSLAPDIVTTYSCLLEVMMADQQSEADKAKAMQEYRERQDAAVRRIETLRAARLARDAARPTPTPKAKKKS
jgi:hypothetical protein